MSSAVKNNLPAQLALGELNKNVNKVGVLLGKVASGQKINSAEDDAGQFAISEKMREQIRTMLQDTQNIQNGSSMLKVAEGGVNNIVEELRNLKELAINSANDTNTNVDRLTIQKEFNQKMANINDIATMTNYNGKPLLDGTYFFKTETIKNFNAPIMIYDDGYNIESDGVYMLTKGFTGTVNVNAQNVKIVQEDISTPLNNVTLLGSENGEINLFIETLNIVNTENKSIVRFNGGDNLLTFKGTSTLVQKDNTFNRAIIHAGNGLTLEDGGDGMLNVQCNGNLTSTAIGLDCYATGTVDGGGTTGYNINSNIIVNSGTYNLFVERAGGGIGMTDNAHLFGNIEIRGGNINVTTNYGSAIGSGSGMMTGNLIIGKATVNVTSVEGAGIGCGSYGSRIDAGDWLDGNIIIGNGAKIIARSINGAGIGAGSQASVANPGYVIISTQAQVSSVGNKTNLYNNTQKEFYYGNRGTIGDLVFEDREIKADLISMEEPNNGFTSATKTTFNSLKIHHGTKANQVINFYINDMHTKSLGIGDLLDIDGNFLVQDDENRYYALSYDKTKQVDWLETLKLAQNKTLDDIDVKTKQHANVAIRVLDGAIEYALNESIRLGAYLQRLDYTDANVTTMSENIQASESKIRDADMAKEMTDYTKANVLSQSAQSMLAQANQNLSQVLSLLQ